MNDLPRRPVLAGVHDPDRTGLAARFLAHTWPAGYRVVGVPAADPVLAVAAHTARPEVDVYAPGDDGGAAYFGEVYDPAADAPARLLRTTWDAAGPEGLGWIDAQGSGVVWSEGGREVALVRDRAGVPPLFYAEHGTALLWATDLTTLLASGVARAVDLHALDAYLAMGCLPAPWTLVEAIRKVPPAHALVRRGREATTVRYWLPVVWPKVRREKRLVPALKERIEASLARRTATGGPFAVLLSGGVDSSLILAGLRRWLDVPVTAYTFDYEGYEGPWNEYERAHRLARHLGVRHEKVPMGPAWVADRLPSLLRQYEEPFTFGIHTARLETLSAGSIGTVLTGALPGFPVAWELPGTIRLALAIEARGIPKGLLRGVRWMFRLGPLKRLRPVVELSSHPLPEMYTRKGVNMILSAETRSRIYRDPRLVETGKMARQAVMEALTPTAGVQNPEDRMALMGSAMLPAEHILWWNHRWGEAHGLWFRYPYLDRDVVTFLARLRGDRNKTLLREVAATIMPREIAFAPKLGQAAPLWRWLAMPPLRDLVRATLTPERLAATGLFRTEPILQALEEHLQGRRAHQWLLWTILSFLLWQEHVLDAPAPDPRLI
ncbi:asparagine synthase C-terminal domain-containing protein [Rhodocaloribacter litoris]|uniref:asparagine synthetase B family protein n=1 Tax=Rhodocaloribacter litoris TaxID=2558931 RepID=UPI00142107A5|nr:asparagine synthase-related protein [Rhodocaloribacter litoris]QXD16150.1 asparagine synthase C-terminal domain-containing protein [Rhodocaloribacter litoris]